MHFFESKQSDPNKLTVGEYVRKKKRIDEKIKCLVAQKKDLDAQIKEQEDKINELNKLKPPTKYVVTYSWIYHGSYEYSHFRDIKDVTKELKKEFMTYKGAIKFIDTIKDDYHYSLIKQLKKSL